MVFNILRSIEVILLIHLLINYLPKVLADGDCVLEGCISCPHGQEACYECNSAYALINYNCAPIATIPTLTYYQVKNIAGDIVRYSEICPEETHYIDDSTDPSSCISCPDSCDGCFLQRPAIGLPVVKCWDCAQGYYMQDSIDHMELDRYSPNWDPICIQITTQKVLNLEIVITTDVQPIELTQLPNKDCGSQQLTFGSFFTALVQIETVCAKQYSTGTLTFTFLDGDHYIMIDHATYSNKETDPNFAFEFLRTTSYDVTFKSRTSKNNVKLYWRTEKLRFFFFKSLTISQLTIDGSENKLYLNQSDSVKAQCFKDRKKCCDSLNSSQYVCDASDRLYRPIGAKYEPNAVGMGLFNLMSSKRYTKDNMPTITISVVDVFNMMTFYPDNIRYFLKISTNYGFISFENTNVDKYYFAGGLISNYRYVVPKRGSYSYTDLDIGLQRRSDCRMQVDKLDKLTYCISIFFTSCQFQNYNQLRYKRKFDDYTSDPKFIESFTLNLFSTLTKVTISSTKFINAIVASTMTDPIKEHFESEKVFQCHNNYDASSESDLLKSSFIKTDPNLHFDQDQISQYTQMLGSHIVWQKFKGALIIDSSTFDSNISYQNPAISIMEYSQYMGASLKPEYMIVNSKGDFSYVANALIYIKGSQFSNNFAFVANSVMSFYSNRKLAFNTNYMSCMAMKFESNTFQNNLGCPTSYFVVSINCRFKDVAASTNDASWYNELNPYNSQKENNDLLTQVVFRGNKFIQNYSIISNALFINGARDINLDSNQFESNGVLIQKVKGEIKTNNNPYYSFVGYNLDNSPYFNNNWMTESTSLFLQHPVAIYLISNKFIANWAISSGDSYIGQSLMLHRILSVTDIKLYSNSFSSHIGLPTKFMADDTEVGFTYSTLPIVSVHIYANKNLAKSITKPIQLDFNQNTFDSNIYKVDTVNKDLLNLKLDSYTLYSLGGSVSLIKLFTDNEIKGSQPISSDYLYVIFKKVNFLIRNSNFTANTHYNGGCMIEISGMNELQAQINIFKSNNNDYNTPQSGQIGGKFCMLQSSPITLANQADNEPKLNIMQSTVTSDKGVFLYDELYETNEQIGDITFTGCMSKDSIIISQDTQQITMEGNSFMGSVGIKGLISVTRTSSIILKDLKVTQSSPYTLYVESVYDYQISGLNIDSNDATLLADYIKSKFTTLSDYNNYVSNNIQSIYFYKSRGQMLDSKFSNNKASSGTVALLRDNSLLKGNNLQIFNNYATNIGGNFYVTDESVINILLSKFTNNTSEQNGGCFFIQNSYFSIKQSNVTFCISKKNSAVARIEQSTVEISQSTFMNNTATLEASIFHSIRSTVDIVTSNFFNNTANSCGIIASDVELNILNSNFTGNGANLKTKNIYATQSTLKIEKSYFYDTQPINKVAGAFIQLFKSTANIMTTLFMKGTANYGGAIMVEAFSDVEINNCFFKNNYASQSGGAIASSSFLQIQDTNFTKNSATINGNDIYFKCQDDLIIRGVNITASKGKSIFVWARNFQTFQLAITGDLTQLEQGSNDEMKGVYAFQTSNVNIQESTFTNLFAIKGAGVHILNEINTQELKTMITNSKFVKNKSQRGGGLYVEGLTNTDVIDTVFQNNLAYYFNDTIGTGNGGAIYYSCPLQFASCRFQVTRTNFVNNQAEMDGGAIKFDQSEVKVDFQTQFANNYAIYGPEIASYPIHLFRATDMSSDTISDFKSPEAFEQGFQRLVTDSYTFDDQVSGLKFNLYYALADHYGNVVKTANSSYARFTTEAQNIYLEGGERVSVNGYFDFSELMVTINPGSFLSMTVSTDAIPDEWLQKARNKQLMEGRRLQSTTKASKGTVPVNVQFRKCKLGEIQDANKCISCPYFKYSNQVNVTEGSSVCKECLENSVCEGQNEVAPISGFWRLTEISENFIACPNSQACLGGYVDNKVQSYTGLCDNGYQGILCMECSEGYARYQDTECVECQDNLFYDLRAVITCIITFVMISVGIKNQLEEGGTEKEHTICLIKIFGNFSQTISIISLFSLQWPTSVSTVTNINNQYLSAPLQVFSMDCYFRGFGVSTTLIRVFITIVTPLAVMLSSVFFFCIFYSIKEGIKLFTDKENKQKLKNAIIITQLVIIFVFHPQIVTASFSLFQCQNLGDDINPEMYSQIEPQLKCFEGEHLLWIKYLGTPSLLLWVFIIPFIMALTLWKFRDIIDRPDIVATYGFITKGYRAEYFYWEIITMYRKSILVIGSIFMKIDPFLSGLNILLYLFFWYMVQYRYQPFLTHQLNQVEEYSLLTQVFYIYFSLYFVVNQSQSFVNISMIILLMITYSGYHIYFCLVYARQKIIEFTETITNVSQEVKHPFLVQIFARLAEVKALACARTWFLEQKQLVENAIEIQRQKQDQKLEQEISNNQSSKIIKDDIKDAVRQQQIKRLEQIDEFLMIKKKNKEMQQVAQKFTNLLQKSNTTQKVDVNQQLKKMIMKVRNKQDTQEEKEPLKGYDNEKEINILQETHTEENDDNFQF